MADGQNLTSFHSPAYISIIQRIPIQGRPDYFIFAKGRYVQEIDGIVLYRVIGDYAVSFGEAFRKVGEILKDFPKNFFLVEELCFSRKEEDQNRKGVIKKLIEGHNSRRHLEKRI